MNMKQMHRSSRLLFKASGIRYLASIALCLALAACNQGLPPDTSGLNLGAMDVQFRESADFISTGAVASVEGGDLHIHALMPVSGASHSDQFDIWVPLRTAVPFTISIPSDPAGIIDYCLGSVAACPDYSADSSQGSGSVTITQLSPSVRGTFSGRLLQVDGSTADPVRTVMSGEFNAIRQ